MASSVLRRSLLAAAAVASVLTLAACAPGTAPVENFSGLPVSDHGDEGGHGEDGFDAGAQAVWLEQGGKLAVTLWGSSTCPWVGTDIRVLQSADEGNTVQIEVPPLPEQPCTMDYVPHTTVFWTPMNVTTTKPLNVEVLEQTLVVPIK